MVMDISRSIMQSIDYELSRFPILVITGPRQAGKTTMLRNELPEYRYVSLENPDNREYAEMDTKGFLEEYDDKVILDEVQRVPKLFSYLQSIVDDRRIMGQYILSGSQNFHLMEQITQTLAGRVAIFTLFPFDLKELDSHKLIPSGVEELITTGFYPAIYDRTINPDRYYSDYIKTYVNRDVTLLVNIQNQTAFKRFLKLCAGRAGSLLNYSKLASDTGVSHATASNWMTLLEASYITYELPPFFKNFNKRQTKSPKLYFYDTGLLCHLLNIRNGELSPSHPYWGHIFENFIITELVKQNAHLNQYKEFYYWRDSHGNEVDLVIPDLEGIHAYEIKSTTTIEAKLFKGLDYFKKIAGDELLSRTLYHAGSTNQDRTYHRVKAWSSLIN